MWITLAFSSAVFASLTSILAKSGIKKTDSTLATALRTIVVFAFSVLMVFVVGSEGQIRSIDTRSLVFLILSGIATGASWLCYFKALQKGNINKVVPIDKSSTVLTIILAFILFREAVGVWKIVGVTLIAVGTFMMIEKKDVKQSASQKSGGWLIYAIGSAIFASLTSILAKYGISGVESNLATAIRTLVVLFMSWIMVLISKKQKGLGKIPPREFIFIILSGIATGASWLCYYKALKDGVTSTVIAIDKLSVLFTVFLSYLIYGEKLTKKTSFGLLLITVGTALMLK